MDPRPGFVIFAFAVIYLFCSQRGGAALVLAYSRLRARRSFFGHWPPARTSPLTAFLQFLRQDLRIPRRSDHPDVVVLRHRIVFPSRQINATIEHSAAEHGHDEAKLPEQKAA